MTTMLGADLIVETLEQEGIDKIFSLPGGQLLPIYYAVMDRPGMETVFCRHEGAATLMASGYSMISGRPSCVMATVGAGIAYEVGPLLLSWRERLPLVSIAPQVQSYKMKPIQENLQACDQDEIFKSVTRFSAIMYHRERIPYLIRRAINAALSPEQGPVHLDVPVDVMYGYGNVSRKKRGELLHDRETRYRGDIVPARGALASTAEKIASSKRPLVLAGRGVQRAMAGKELISFLETVGAPALVSTPAFSVISSECGYNAGVATQWLNDEGTGILSETDLVILVEADEETAVLCRSLSAAGGMNVINLSSCEKVAGSIVSGEIKVYGSAARTLRELTGIIASMNKPTDAEWIERIIRTKTGFDDKAAELLNQEKKSAFIAEVMKSIGPCLGPDDILVCEGSMTKAAAVACLARSGTHNTFLPDEDLVAGSGFPLALGMKFAKMDRRVFLFTEAGCFKHHMRELQTMSRYGAPISILVFGDRDEKPGHEVDFCSLSENLGVRSLKAVSEDEGIAETLIEENLHESPGLLVDYTGCCKQLV